MAIFRIEITETLQYVTEVEAKSKEEAVEIVQSQYDNEEIVLDSSDHIETNIKVIEDEND